MQDANQTHRRMLRRAQDMEELPMKEHRSKESEKGWDDAMGHAANPVNPVFAESHGQSPQEQRLDNVQEQREDRKGKTNDPVNHPSHYTCGKIEVIDFLEDQQFPYHLGNAVKYISRAGKKDPGKTVEDLEKAVWYINRYIGLLKKVQEAQDRA